MTAGGEPFDAAEGRSSTRMAVTGKSRLEGELDASQL
jgi:hypothetical protein